jgi:uncharacterized protein (DUF1800 family)
MTDHNQVQAIAQAARGRTPREKKPVPTPQRLHATAVRPTHISLAWKPVHVPGHRVTYEVARNGRRIAQVAHHARFDDRRVAPSTTYRYKVRVRMGRRLGRFTRPISVRTPALPPPPAPTLTEAMVNRMFWRAGFGPTAADRLQWTGESSSALVEHFLTAPYGLTPTATPPTDDGNPIDPLASDRELQMEWLDRMQRATNPFVERMNFFWHRHFAVSRDTGIPATLLLAYRDRLRRYSDFATNPSANFHDLALEMTTQDAAMSTYLTGFLNVKNSPNENYAREFMELFTLGVTNEQGIPNYSQNDVHELARAFTGYTLNQSTGVVSFNPKQYDTGFKTILGRSGAFDAPAAVAIVLSQPSHGRFLVRKLWSEFIEAPIPADAEAQLVSTYVSSGLQLAPVLRGILSHPLIFDSLNEPTMIKPPVVYTVGLLRALGAPLRDNWQTAPLYNMQQQPYHPPNVAGWEGGLSWMTTSTSSARFDLVVRCQQLLPVLADIPVEPPQAALTRAYVTCGAPWLSPQTWASLLAFAQQAPVKTAAQRRARQYAMQAFILGGPDGQVM